MRRRYFCGYVHFAAVSVQHYCNRRSFSFFTLKLKKMTYPIQISAANLEEIISQYPNAKVKEINPNFNMLFIKDNQTAAITESNKCYLLTH